jgi:hypothetical protein
MGRVSAKAGRRGGQIERAIIKISQKQLPKAEPTQKAGDSRSLPERLWMLSDIAEVEEWPRRGWEERDGNMRRELWGYRTAWK